jgi:hypothetical protein
VTDYIDLQLELARLIQRPMPDATRVLELELRIEKVQAARVAVRLAKDPADTEKARHQLDLAAYHLAKLTARHRAPAESPKLKKKRRPKNAKAPAMVDSPQSEHVEHTPATPTRRSSRAGAGARRRRPATPARSTPAWPSGPAAYVGPRPSTTLPPPAGAQRPDQVRARRLPGSGCARSVPLCPWSTGRAAEAKAPQACCRRRGSKSSAPAHATNPEPGRGRCCSALHERDTAIPLRRDHALGWWEGPIRTGRRPEVNHAVHDHIQS